MLQIYFDFSRLTDSNEIFSFEILGRVNFFSIGSNIWEKTELLI